MIHSTPKDVRVHLELTLEQAAALVQAADLYSRVCIGQIEEIELLIREGRIPCADNHPQRERTIATIEQCDQIRDRLNGIKIELGYHPNASFGIGHEHIHVSATRAFEIRKVVEKAVAEHRDPNPKFRGVNYDGLICRYTTDPAPVARIEDAVATD